MEHITVPGVGEPTGRSSIMRTLARVTAPLARPLAGRRLFPIWAVLHTRGRRSGRELAIPVVVRRTQDGFVIPLPFGEGTQWTKNVIAAGGCEVRWAGADHALMHPQLVGIESVADAFSPFQRWALPRIGADRFMRLRDNGVG
jgi:hypothetical protein